MAPCSVLVLLLLALCTAAESGTFEVCHRCAVCRRPHVLSTPPSHHLRTPPAHTQEHLVPVEQALVTRANSTAFRIGLLVIDEGGLELTQGVCTSFTPSHTLTLPATHTHTHTHNLWYYGTQNT